LLFFAACQLAQPLPRSMPDYSGTIGGEEERILKEKVLLPKSNPPGLLFYLAKLVFICPTSTIYIANSLGRIVRRYW
jgi:hypothetical protein